MAASGTQTNRPLRPDGRASGGTLRPLSAEVSCLNRADGSAMYRSGDTQILAAVYGPASPRSSSRECADGAVVAVAFKHGRRGGAGTTAGDGGGSKQAPLGEAPPGYGATERELEHFVGDAVGSAISLENYPRSVIEVVLQVIKADGGVVAAAVNAAVLALLDAGVTMQSLPVATTCLVPAATPNNAGGGKGGALTVRLDPTAKEESEDDSSVVVLVTSSIREQDVIVSMTFGATRSEAFLACVEGASKASKAIVAFVRLALEQKVTREAQTLWSS